MKNFKRILSVVLVVMMVATMFVPSMAAETEVTPYVTSNGATMTIHELHDVRDFYIAEGVYNTYREVKDAGYLFGATAKKLGDATEYSYVVKNGGEHTVVIRYNDGVQLVMHHTIEVDEPVFETNGLQVKVHNIPDVKVIRTAYGEYYTPGDTKRAEGSKNFGKNEIKGKDPYTLWFRNEGLVTIAVEYNHGYKVMYHYYVTKNTPTVEQGAYSVTFGNLDNLQHIRYVEGVFDSSSEMKATGKSKLVKPAAIVDGYITVDNLAIGTYTFCVQYTDESYNYYVIEITGEEPTPELGSYENPYLVNVGDTRVAVYVPAGADAYVKASDSNNTVLTVGYATTADYMINYLRQTYYADTTTGNNDTSFTMVADVDTFCVTNTGTEDVVLYMALAAGEAVDNSGTWDNPEVLELTEQYGALRAFSTKDLEAGNQGRYYKVTAPADGKLGFYVSASDADGNETGWQFYYINGSTYSDTYTNVDYAYQTIFADVKAGDEVTLVVATFNPDDVYNNPAATINVSAAFVENGSVDAPIAIEEAGMFTAEAAAGSQGIYYTYVAPSAGTVEVIMYSENWQYVVNNLTTYAYGETHCSDAEEPVTCETLSVAAGDELQIMVNTYDPADTWNAPEGTVSWELAFYPGESEEPEEAELGAYENPYIVNAGDTRVAAYIPAGATVYVKATDANNSTFTLGYATAATYEIWYLRTLYTADTESGNNDTSFTMVADVDTFGITNTGDEAITVYMALEAGAAVDNSGTWDNPEVLELTEQFGALRAFSTKDLEAGNQGRYYKVTAPADGKLGFYVSASDADGNETGWQFYYINGSTYSDTYTNVDYAYQTIFADVVAGDEVTLVVATFNPDDVYNNPAATINVNATFVENGSSDAPIAIEAGDHTATVKEGSNGMYYTFTAPANGNVKVTMNSDAWVYSVMNSTSYVYGNTYYSTDETVVASDVIYAEAGDVITVMVNTNDGTWTAPAGTVEWTLTFTEKAWKVTFDPDGGYMPDVAKQVYGIDYNENYKEATGIDYPVPTMDGYTFAGWYWELYNYTLDEGTWNGGYFAVQMDVDLVALWEEAVA